MAKSIKPKVTIPLNVQRVVQRAIRARRRCADWFRQTGAKSDASVEGHDHFISILEEALGILKPCYTSFHNEVEERKTPDMKSTCTYADIFTKRFGTLDVEDTDLSLDIAAHDVSMPNKNSAVKSAQPVYDVFELENEFDIDLAFLSVVSSKICTAYRIS